MRTVRQFLYLPHATIDTVGTARTEWQPLCEDGGWFRPTDSHGFRMGGAGVRGQGVGCACGADVRGPTPGRRLVYSVLPPLARTTCDSVCCHGS